MAELEKVHYLYKITNLINSKVYIGVTCNPEHRKKCHLLYAKSQGRTSLIKDAVIKYGKDNFNFEVLCSGKKAYIYNLEPEAIKLYCSHKDNNGYNIEAGGLGGKGSRRGKVEKRKDDLHCFVSGFWFPNARLACLKLNISRTKFRRMQKKGTLGHTTQIKKERKDSKPVYILGFWFPNRIAALKALNISTNFYHKLIKEDKPSEAFRKVSKSALDSAVYFKGFWFPDTSIPADIFKIKPVTLRQRILRGYSEENSKLKSPVPQKVYVINGQVFEDLRFASDTLNVPYDSLRQKFYKKTAGYHYDYKIK